MLLLCLSVHIGGYPSLWSQVPSQPLVPCPFWWVTPASGSMSFLGYLSLWSHVLWRRGVPSPSQGVPSPVWGYPSLNWGYHSPVLGTPWLGPGYHSQARTGMGYLPARRGLGYPPQPGQNWGTPWPGLGYNSPRTGYPTGGIPLAVSHRRTFLFCNVLHSFIVSQFSILCMKNHGLLLSVSPASH